MAKQHQVNRSVRFINPMMALMIFWKIVPLLQEYIMAQDIVRPYFEVQPDSSLEDFEAKVYNRPVFLLEER